MNFAYASRAGGGASRFRRRSIFKMKMLYVGGRKGYLQTHKVEVYWDDARAFEKNPVERPSGGSVRRVK